MGNFGQTGVKVTDVYKIKAASGFQEGEIAASEYVNLAR